ncbi:MAG TPA: IclR family transcriptional regulator [Marmoricola sp.]
MAGNTSMPGATVTSRALALLGAFDQEHRSLTLSEMAARAGLAVPTAHRLVGELVEFGALARRPDGAYVIGRRIWDLGLLAPAQTGLRQVAEPFLHDIYGATLATVHLAVRDGTEVLYLDRLAGHASVPVLSTVGSRLPLHATGVGKVLLAHAPEEVQEQVLASLERVTAYTITQPGRLRVQLAAVRRQGYATTVEEMSLGACSVGVPITRDGRVVAALGIVVPSLKRDRARLVAALQVAAQGVNRSLADFRPAESSAGGGHAAGGQ